MPEADDPSCPPGCRDMRLATLHSGGAEPGRTPHSRRCTPIPARQRRVPSPGPAMSVTAGRRSCHIFLGRNPPPLHRDRLRACTPRGIQCGQGARKLHGRNVTIRVTRAPSFHPCQRRCDRAGRNGGAAPIGARIRRMPAILASPSSVRHPGAASFGSMHPREICASSGRNPHRRLTRHATPGRSHAPPLPAALTSAVPRSGIGPACTQDARSGPFFADWKRAPDHPRTPANQGRLAEHLHNSPSVKP